MSKKAKLAAEQAAAESAAVAVPVRRPSVSFKVMNNCAPVPVAKPADFIQLTPIVQPISFVPYSSQLQPIAQFDEEE
jgi:hypothetical protein